MIRHFGQRSSWSFLAFSAVLLSGAVGCHHRLAQPVLLPAQTAVPIETTPASTNATLVETPKTKLPPVPVARDEPNPKKTKKLKTKSVASSGAAPGTTAAIAPAPAVAAPPSPPAKQTEQAADVAPSSEAAAPDAESIGIFTVGGDQSPRNRQEAANLIAANDRRLAAVSGDRGHADSSLLMKVRNFQREAEQALNSGDAEGAKTLATKGKLLLDDMDRGVPSQ